MANNNKKAFILAAGFGTRLRPLTDNLPKALVPYKNKPMIENVISKLSSAGFKDIIINTHHFSDLMNDYFNNRKGEENITLINEKEILGTGGAVKNAESFLINSDYFILYNSDVDCEVSIESLVNHHLKSGALVTLCVQDRITSRCLLTDNEGHIIGRIENNKPVIYKDDFNSECQFYKVAFCGIQLINSQIFDFIKPYKYPFDIIPIYMNLIKIGKFLNIYNISRTYWKDLGIPQNL